MFHCLLWHYSKAKIFASLALSSSLQPNGCVVIIYLPAPPPFQNSWICPCFQSCALIRYKLSIMLLLFVLILLKVHLAYIHTSAKNDLSLTSFSQWKQRNFQSSQRMQLFLLLIYQSCRQR